MEALDALLAVRRTEEVVGKYLAYCLERANGLQSDGPFVSPVRQGDVLLSVLVSSPEPDVPMPFGDTQWSEAVDLLNQGFMSYLELFWPSGQEFSEMSEEWGRVREVAMPAFLHYFNTGLLASPEQVADRIRAYVVPFNDSLEKAGIPSATSALAIADWISRKLQRNIEAFQTTRDEVRALQRKFGTNLRGARAYTAEHLPNLGDRLASALDELGVISRDSLVEQFGEAGARYWDAYSIARGAGGGLTYPTDDTVVATRPLIRLSEGRAMIPAVNSLFTAILTAGEKCLSESAVRDKYFAHRDSTLETEVASQLHRLTSSDAIVHRNVFETRDSQKEHDIILIAGDAVFLVEAKASPPPEPFRDPEKAFTRLRRAFRAETGIQKGFEQAESVRCRLERGERVQLFDRHGKDAVLLDPDLLPRRYSVIVTRDDFGPIATDLSLLLQKQNDAPFPWVVNVLDLSALGDAWEHLGWGTAELESYIDARALLHGKVISTDELEIAGFFIEYGSFGSLLTATADMICLDHHCSDFFDALWAHLHHGSPPPTRLSKQPVILDMRESMRRGVPVLNKQDTEETPAVGSRTPMDADRPHRNARCPCGSGMRFRKCCGRRS